MSAHDNEYEADESFRNTTAQTRQRRTTVQRRSARADPLHSSVAESIDAYPADVKPAFSVDDVLIDADDGVSVSQHLSFQEPPRDSIEAFVASLDITPTNDRSLPHAVVNGNRGLAYDLEKVGSELFRFEFLHRFD